MVYDCDSGIRSGTWLVLVTRDTTCSLATCTCKYSELLLLIGRSGEDIVIFSTLANIVLLGNMSWDTDF